MPLIPLFGPEIPAAVSLSTTSTLTTAAEHETPAAVSMSTTSTLTTTATHEAPAAASLSTTSTLTAGGVRERTAEVALTATSTLGAVTPRKIETFVDDGTSLAAWNYTAGDQFAVNAGAIRVTSDGTADTTVQGASKYPETNPTYYLADSWFVLEVPSWQATNVSGWSVVWRPNEANNSFLGVGFMFRPGGVVEWWNYNIGNAFTYPVGTRFFAVRVVGTTVFWFRSIDGVTWTQIASREAAHANISVPNIGRRIGVKYQSGTPANGDFIDIAGINTGFATPVPMGVLGAAALTATSTLNAARQQPAAVALTAASTLNAILPVHTLTDDFTTKDTSKWSWPAGADIDTGELALTLAADSWTSITSQAVWSLANSSVTVGLAEPPASWEGVSAGLYFGDAGDHYVLSYGWNGVGVTLTAEAAVGGVSDILSADLDPTMYPWLRITGTATTVVFEASADRVTWVEVLQSTIGATLGPLQVFGSLGEALPSQTVRWDNLNVIPAGGVSGAASLVTTSTLTTAAQALRQAAASLATTATLTASGTRQQPASAGLTTASTLTTAVTRVVPAAIAFVTTSSFTVSAFEVLAGAVSLQTTSMLTASPVRVAVGIVSMSTTSSLAAGAFREIATAVSMISVSSLSTTAVRAVLADAALASVSTLAVAGVPVRVSAVSLVGSSVLDVAADRTVNAAIAMISTSGLVTSALVITPANVAFAASSTLTTAATRAAIGSVALVAASTLTTAGTVTQRATVAMTTSATMLVSLAPLKVATVAMTGSATLATAAVAVRVTTVTMSGTAALTVSALRIVVPGVDMTSSSTLSTAALAVRVATAAFTTTSTLNVLAVPTRIAAVVLNSVSTLAVTASTFAIVTAEAAMTATSSLVTAAVRAVLAAVTMQSDASLEVAPPTREVPAAASLATQSVLYTTVVPVRESAVAMASTFMLVVPSPIASTDAGVVFTASSTLTVNASAFTEIYDITIRGTWLRVAVRSAGMRVSPRSAQLRSAYGGSTRTAQFDTNLSVREDGVLR